ncbi:MAG: hypothetical protein V3573_05085 [Desulfovibrionaceae bacterium]
MQQGVRTVIKAFGPWIAAMLLVLLCLSGSAFAGPMVIQKYQAIDPAAQGPAPPPETEEALPEGSELPLLSEEQVAGLVVGKAYAGSIEFRFVPGVGWIMKTGLGNFRVRMTLSLKNFLESQGYSL